ncbi:lipid kinase [Candidatus Poribacteria bacterium]|nr:lipid kinase [Candidatus Poribacteria bacterium]
MKPKFYRYIIFTLVLAAVMSLSFAGNTWAKPKKFKAAWSIYAGWQPWDYANQSGILKKWADKYNIEIELVRMDYIPSIEAYVAKKVDACVMTNMEALDMPAASGINTTALILGDFSNGNDAVLTRDNTGIKDLNGEEIYLVELSVSHYLLARALEMNNMDERNVILVNTSDSDIAPAFIANGNQKAVVTWNPLVMQILQEPGISKIFDSSKIPGEILDLMVVRTGVLKENPEFGKALTGAWYEVMDIMSQRGSTADEAMSIMAESAGCSLTEYKMQLKTTAMFYKPQGAVEYTNSEEIKQKMNYVRKFCFEHGLLGENARSVDEVGIKYPDGSIQGDTNNVYFIFDSSFMKMAADGKL